MTGASSWTLDGRYAVRLDQPRGRGFAASDARGGELIAIPVQPGLPPRQRALETLMATPAAGVINPRAHGPGPSKRAAGDQDYYVLCETPVGSPLDVRRPWSEAELVRCFLLPAVASLGRLQAIGLTHRAIRPDNVFQLAPGEPVVLGEAWSAPPAAFQPAWAEPPYSAACLQAGRGEGSIADDIYALGALMVVLALGRTRLDGLAPDDVVRAKLDLGSFDALAGDARLPSSIADLACGMLAEDPDHRPGPALLLDPGSARARRLAARPPRRAAAPVQIGATAAWTARAAAHAIATQPEAGAAVLTRGTIDAWLRRSLGDPALAARLDDALHPPTVVTDTPAAEAAMTAMRAVAVLDPLAPLAWQGLLLWPDAIGPALAGAEVQSTGQAADSLIELVSSEAVAQWAYHRAERCDLTELRAESRRLRSLLGGARPGNRRTVAVRRLAYALNPLIPCSSPMLAGHCVARASDLIAALEAGCAAGGSTETGRIIDGEIGAFLAARSEHTQDAELAKLALRGDDDAGVAELELLARLQARSGGTVPGLARRIAANHDRLLQGWFNQERRARLAAELMRLADDGQLGPILVLVRDPVARAEDEAGARAAARRLLHLDAELAGRAAGEGMSRMAARGVGQEIAAGLGLAALAASLAWALLAT